MHVAHPSSETAPGASLSVILFLLVPKISLGEAFDLLVKLVRSGKVRATLF